MRAVLAAAAVVVTCLGGAGGQEKKAEPKYDSVKDLDRKAKAALDDVKRRGDGYLDKGIVAFGEVISRSDPNSAAAQRVAGQAAFFLHKLYGLKEAAAIKEYQDFGTEEKARELSKVRREQELWAKAARTAAQDGPALERAWLVIQRAWTLEDLKKQ